MEVGKIIIAKVVAIGADRHSFMFSMSETSNKPIIVEDRLKMNGVYKIEITRDATNFYMAKVIEKVEKEDSNPVA